MNYEESLENVNRAISAIESGAQEYRIGNRTLRRADLATLYGERVRLENCVANSGGSGIVYARLARRR